VGVMRYPKDNINYEALFEGAIEAGAQNIETSDKGYEIECSLADFAHIRDQLMEKFEDPESAELIWKPHIMAPVDEEKAPSLMKLLDILEDNDDVQAVFANFEMSDDVMEKLASGKP
jgi:transcriptional/translational regulatory protein YebC/TACO1